eukprot:m.166617 g.166617  ORF g.166617 m.166617 type:complete len:607 (-) comp31434_c0_seq1:94-1914(-)
MRPRAKRQLLKLATAAVVVLFIFYQTRPSQPTAKDDDDVGDLELKTGARARPHQKVAELDLEEQEHADVEQLEANEHEVEEEQHEIVEHVQHIQQVENNPEPEPKPLATERVVASTRKYQRVLTPPADARDEVCKPEQERLLALPPGTLPNTSVIFCFCNEPSVSLYHSMRSVIERSPPHLLHEIILVDDGSDAPHLQKELEDFVQTLPVPVTIVRQKYRSGLMRARVAGAKAATGETLTFLDSHISCSIGWLEPCMYRISQDWQNVVMPKIDTLDREFNYKPGGVELIGFNSKLVDHGMQLQKVHDFKGRTANDPQPSPAMAGGLFSINRKYFFHIGAFDEGMLHWGGENIEIGFRVWMCGGRIEMIPCSRIGHVWGGMGKTCGWPGASPGAVNKWRAIDVWMDNYTTFMEQFLPRPAGGVGDLTDMINLRKRLNCKSFQWFLDNVFPESWIQAVITAKRGGVLQNVESGLCLDPRAIHGPEGLLAKMKPCKTGKGRDGNTQFFWLTIKDELRLNIFGTDMDHCLEAQTPGNGYDSPQPVGYYGCHGYHGNQQWLWTPIDSIQKEVGVFRHGNHGCLAAFEDQIKVVKCGQQQIPKLQQWVWIEP